MSDANFLKETMEFFIFTTPTGLHSNDFETKFMLNMLLEIKENLINIGTFLKQVIPNNGTIITYAAYVILMFYQQKREPDPIHHRMHVPKEQQ
jgi:hypothetical protein